ncbi:MAG: helix-turn-helix domain-containing protein [Muribaculaceae bacterium]
MGKADYTPDKFHVNEVVLHPGNDGMPIAAYDDISSIPAFDVPAKLQIVLSAICLRGSLDAEVDFKDHTLAPHDLLVLLPGHVLTSYKASDDFEGFFIVASSEALYDTMPSFSSFLHCALHFKDNPVIRLSDIEVESQLSFHLLLQKKLRQSNYPFRKEVIQTLCEGLFYETLGLYTLHMRDNIPPMTRRDELMLKFMNLVARDFKRERSVAYYADNLCVTPKHLSSVVKEASGRTAGEWIDSHVVLEAKLLLKNTGMTIQEIAVSLNFANQSFFGKYFKHLTGMSPREYRVSPN